MATKPQYLGIGQLQVVPNEQRRFGADPEYCHVQLMMDPDTKLDFLFTPEELERARVRAAHNHDDLPRPRGFWQRLHAFIFHRY
jgi:hypothetical protein